MNVKITQLLQTLHPVQQLAVNIFPVTTRPNCAHNYFSWIPNCCRPFTSQNVGCFLQSWKNLQIPGKTFHNPFQTFAVLLATQACNNCEVHIHQHSSRMPQAKEIFSKGWMSGGCFWKKILIATRHWAQLAFVCFGKGNCICSWVVASSFQNRQNRSEPNRSRSRDR